MNIGIDIMGGDFAPEEAVKGIGLYLSETDSTANLFAIGDEQKVLPLLASNNIPAGRVSVIHAEDTIGMHEHPTRALKEKQKSSISIGFHLLASGKTDAFVSAGNSGAMLVGAMYSLKPLEGVLRPTISTIIPKENGKKGVLLDVGLNADCKPEHLNQFATLGSLYAKHILGIPDPTVALLNIGEEEGKGNILCQSAFALLKENPSIRFTGNAEGRDILIDKADVIVCEGFTGNIILKMAESIYDITISRSVKDEYFDQFNFEIYGGTPVLGVSKPVIIGHGISKALAFQNMIALAEKMVTKKFTDIMKASFAAK